MDKKREIAFNLNNFALATSVACDAVESHLYQTTAHHSKRIAYIALKLAVEFNYSAESLFDLCGYALLHNIGLKQSGDKSNEYCELSNEYAKAFPFLTQEKDILKYQCEFYDGSGPFGLKKDKIPLFSQFIACADIIDSKFSLENPNIENRKEIITFLKKNENRLFSTDIVECMCEFSEQTSFWLELQSEHDILTYIYKILNDYSCVKTFEELLSMSSIFTKMIDGNLELLTISEKMTAFYHFEHKDTQTFLLAASLCKVGKLLISDEVLNKNSTLTYDEYEIIKAYPFYTNKILTNIMGFNDIATWASRIQESNDSKGYPFGLDGKDLSLKDRLLSTLVVYHSLCTNQPFRDAYTHQEAITMMKEMALKNKIDKAIVEDIQNVLA